MVYSSSEAHLFSLYGAGWVGDMQLCIPDTFTGLGITSSGVSESLYQGILRGYGTDVCHMKEDGLILDASFYDTINNVSITIPPTDLNHSDSCLELKRTYGGTTYSVVGLNSSFDSVAQQHVSFDYVVSLNWSKPCSTTVWQSSWVNPSLKYRYIYVYATRVGSHTGWQYASATEILNYPRKGISEEVQFRITQYRQGTDYWTSIRTDKGIRGDIPDTTKLYFKLNEYHMFLPTLSSLRTDLPWYSFDQAPKSRAFLAACDGLPVFEGNTFANAIEIIVLLRKLKRGKFAEAADVPKKWYNWWLQYRYRYSTTKSDLEDMVSLRKSLGAFHRAFSEYRRNVYGYYFEPERGIAWRCEIQAVNRACSQIDQIYHGLETMGLSLSIYNLWDLVPYSFIVDWIFPVGDITEILQRNEYFSSDYWDFEKICYSATYTQGYTGEYYSGSATIYDRWYEYSPPNLDQYYWERDSSTSLKASILRLVDGLSILISRHK